MDNVQPGDPFPLLKVDNLNQVISATNKVNRCASNVTLKNPTNQIIQTVRIFNETGQDLDALSIIELGKVHIEYEQNREMFRKRPVIKALKPGDANGTQTYGVVTKSLENGGYGEVAINGILTVKINITDTSHLYAAAIDGDCSKLESASEGVFKILCHAKSSSQTGEQWCCVYFPVARGYCGYFTVIKSGENKYSVIDGMDSGSDSCGKAQINGQVFSIDKPAEIESESDIYIYLNATATTDAGSGSATLNKPTIKYSGSFPDFTENECNILLARITNGKISQEHHGAVYGIIWGNCE